MNSKMIGIILIIIGVALSIWGYNIYDSVGSQLNRSLTGDGSTKAWAAMVGGTILTVLGIYKVK